MPITDNATAYMPPEIAKLNALMGRELGYTPHGEPIYMFQWTEDLFWPLYKTGAKVAETRTYEVPIISLDPNVPSSTEAVEEKKLVPEYQKARMTHKYQNQWIATAWLPPEGLREWVVQNNDDPQMDKAALQQWATNYEGADYPHAGFRVCTNYVIPRGDVPNIDDVARFCAGVRYNRSMSAIEIGQRLKDEFEKAHPMPATHPDEYNFNSEIGAAIAENFNAFLNPAPGKRGGSVSIGGIGENPVLRRKKARSQLIEKCN
jgi:hypothetical protein